MPYSQNLLKAAQQAGQVLPFTNKYLILTPATSHTKQNMYGREKDSVLNGEMLGKFPKIEGQLVRDGIASSNGFFVLIFEAKLQISAWPGRP